MGLIRKNFLLLSLQNETFLSRVSTATCFTNCKIYGHISIADAFAWAVKPSISKLTHVGARLQQQAVKSIFNYVPSKRRVHFAELFITEQIQIAILQRSIQTRKDKAITLFQADI
jgi:hypothetical protein